MTSPWKEVIGQALYSQAKICGTRVTDLTQCIVSDIRMETCYPMWSGGRAVSPFRLDAHLRNIDGFVPAWASFHVPSTLPLEKLSTYWPHWDPVTRSYWMRYAPEPTVPQKSQGGMPTIVADTCSDNTSCVSSTLAHEQTCDGNPQHHISETHAKLAAGASQLVQPANQSCAALQLIDPAIVAIGSTPAINKTIKFLTSPPVDLVVVSSHHAHLDLAVRETPKATVCMPGYLDLALDDIQVEYLSVTLHNIDLGRPAKIRNEIARARAENTVTETEITYVLPNVLVQPSPSPSPEKSQLAVVHPSLIESENALETQTSSSIKELVTLEKDDSDGKAARKSPVVSLSSSITDHRRLLASGSPVSITEPGMVEALSREEFEFDHEKPQVYLEFKRSKAQKKRARQIRKLQGQTAKALEAAQESAPDESSNDPGPASGTGDDQSPSTSSPEQSIGSTQASPGNSSPSTIEIGSVDAAPYHSSEPVQEYTRRPPPPSVCVETPLVIGEPMTAGGKNCSTIVNACEEPVNQRQLSKSETKRACKASKPEAKGTRASANQQQSTSSGSSYDSTKGPRPQADDQACPSGEALEFALASLSRVVGDPSSSDKSCVPVSSFSTESTTINTRAEEKHRDALSSTPVVSSADRITHVTESFPAAAPQVSSTGVTALERATSQDLSNVATAPDHTNVDLHAQEAFTITDVAQAVKSMSKSDLSSELDTKFGKLPTSWADSEEDQTVACTQGSKPVNTRKVRKVLEESKPQGKSNHLVLIFAMQHLRQSGFAQVRILQEADQSLAWFHTFFHFGNPDAASIIKADKLEDLASAENPIPVLANPDELDDYHHLNYLSQMVRVKSATPSAVSLWAVVTCKDMYEKTMARQLPRTTVTKAVLVSQAWKYVDPWTYSGPDELLEKRGTDLRESVTGFVDRVYAPSGTWGSVGYDQDDEIPFSGLQIQDYSRYDPGEKVKEHYEAVRPFTLGDSCTNAVLVARKHPPLPSSYLPLREPSLLRVSESHDDDVEVKPVPLSSTVVDEPAAVDYGSVGEYHQSDEEIDADDQDFYGNTADIAATEESPTSVDGSVGDEADCSKQGDIEESRARTEIDHVEHLVSFLDSPDRVQNQLMNSFATPTIFRQHPVIDDTEFSDTTTELGKEHHPVSQCSQDDDDDAIVDVRALGPAAVTPATDIEFGQPGVGDLGIIVEEDDTGLGPSIPQEEPSKGIGNGKGGLPPVPENEEANVALIHIHSRQISGNTVSTGFHSRQISGELTPLTPLSPAFPAAVTDTAQQPDAAELRSLLRRVSQGCPLTAVAEVPDNDGSVDIDGLDLLATSLDKPAQRPSNDIDSLQVVLYEPQPRWFNILMIFARSLKRATTLLHKSGPIEAKVKEVVDGPKNVDMVIPDRPEVIPDHPDFDKWSFERPTIHVGKQGIKVAKAAVGVGMMPIHAAVEMAKMPYKTAKTTWKVGHWTLSRFFQRR